MPNAMRTVIKSAEYGIGAAGLRSSQAKAKRLSFGTPEGKPSRRPLPPLSEEQNESALADVKDTGKDAELARQLRRQSLDGTLPVSLSALRVPPPPPPQQSNHTPATDHYSISSPCLNPVLLSGCLSKILEECRLGILDSGINRD